MRTITSLVALAAALACGSADAQPRAPRVPATTLRAAAARAPTAALTNGAPPRRPAPVRRVLRAGLPLRAPVVPASPVVTVLQRMETTLQYTRYSMDNRVDPLMGHYELDAPGLVTWVLRRATPAAHRAVFAQVRARSPTARDYHDILAAAAPEHVAGDAWLRLTQVGALRPGDVIAWRRALGAHPASNGHHVAFVVAAPVRAAAGGAWLVRVTDSTAVPHDNDTRGPQAQHRSGLGTGTLLVSVDPTTDAPTGYGWTGTRAVSVTPASVALGRPLR